MTDFRRADEVWDEDEAADEAQTLVARNPLSERAPQASPQPASVDAREQDSVDARGQDSEDDGDDGVMSVRESDFEILDASSDLRESVEALRDSELERLQLEAEPEGEAAPRDPAAAPAAESGDPREAAREQDNEAAGPETLPSVVLAPSFSARNEVTERISTIPRTHPLANSIAPTTAPKSLPPAAGSRTPLWQLGLAAAALLGVGVGLARWQEQPRGASAKTQIEAREAAPSQAARPIAASAQVAPVAPDSAPTAQEPPVAEPLVASAPARTVAPQDEAQPPASTAPSAEAVALTATREVTPAPARVQSKADRRAVRAPRPVDNAKVAVDATPAAKVEQAPKLQAVAPEPSAELPERPSREQVVAVMDAVRAEVIKCTGGRAGIAELSLTVRGSGQVSYALVNGTFAGTPEGSCIANVLRAAKFPAFQDAILRVNYPLQL